MDENEQVGERRSHFFGYDDRVARDRVGSARRFLRDPTILPVDATGLCSMLLLASNSSQVLHKTTVDSRQMVRHPNS